MGEVSLSFRSSALSIMPAGHRKCDSELVCHLLIKFISKKKKGTAFVPSPTHNSIGTSMRRDAFTFRTRVALPLPSPRRIT